MSIIKETRICAFLFLRDAEEDAGKKVLTK